MTSEDIILEVTEPELAELPEVPDPIILSCLDDQKLASLALQEFNHCR